LVLSVLVFVNSIVKVNIVDLLVDLKVPDNLVDSLVVWGVPYINSLVLCVYLDLVLLQRFPDKANLGLFLLELLLSLKKLCPKIPQLFFVLAHSFTFFLTLTKIVL
jgi:hypothetical protein